jgi:hypothetical protein
VIHDYRRARTAEDRPATRRRRKKTTTQEAHERKEMKNRLFGEMD